MRLRRLGASGAWLLALVAVAFGLFQLGHGSLALPASNAAAWQTWLQETDPTTVVFALARVCVLVIDLYLIATTILLGIASLLRIRPLQLLALAITLPSVRRVMQRALGVSLAGALAMPMIANAANATTASSTSDAPTLRHLAPGDPDPTFPETTTTIKAPVSNQPLGEQSVPAQSGVASPPPETHTHVVMTGENLWTIADAELTASLGRRPNTEEVRIYWLKVIERNRATLPEPAKPSLIYPGQVISFPESA